MLKLKEITLQDGSDSKSKNKQIVNYCVNISFTGKSFDLNEIIKFLQKHKFESIKITFLCYSADAGSKPSIDVMFDAFELDKDFNERISFAKKEETFLQQEKERIEADAVKEKQRLAKIVIKQKEEERIRKLLLNAGPKIDTIIKELQKQNKKMN